MVADAVDAGSFFFFSGHGVIVPSSLSHLSGFSSQHFSHGGSRADKDANSPQINRPFGRWGVLDGGGVGGVEAGGGV